MRVLTASIIFVFLFQALTGVCLALYYVPAIDHAHTTVDWIQKEVPGGSFIRALHYWASNLLILLLIGLVIEMFTRGAWKDAGILLVLVALAFAFTGRLLPWDQKGYFTTLQVARAFGAAKLGSLTLSRFYVLHTMVLPVIALLVVWFYCPGFRRLAGTAGLGPVFAVLAILAITRPAVLEPVANIADTQYLARPDWYLLPFFYLVKILDDRLAILIVVTMVGILILIPRLERTRRYALAALVGVAVVAGGLSVLAVRDYAQPENRIRLEKQAALAADLALKPFEPDPIGGILVKEKDKIPPVPPQFAACADCHGDLGGGGLVGSDLINVGRKYGSAEKLEAVLLNPGAFGIGSQQMPRFTDEKMPAVERRALVDYLISLARN
jgi:quinol-cytochrome oxidoreductase complex cytochrome b subunit